MPKKQTPFTFRFIFYKYDISDKQDKSDVEYEILFSEVINNGFWIEDMSWLDDEINSPDLDSYKCCQELEFNQVHEIVVNVEPWAKQCSYEGDWDGGVHWHDVAHRRLTGDTLKFFLIHYPRCNRLQGLEDEYKFRDDFGDGGKHIIEYDFAVGGVPKELKDLTIEQQDSMIEYFKKILKKHFIGEDE